MFNVLIVDDSPAMRTVIRRVLLLAGIPLGNCAEAGDGIEALAALREGWFDVVLTDINMPRMNGEALLEEMKKDPMTASIPVVVVSTDQTGQRLERMLALGAHGYVQKPFLPETLRDEIDRALGVTHGLE